MRWLIKSYPMLTSVGSCKNQRFAVFRAQASEEREAAYWHTKEEKNMLYLWLLSWHWLRIQTFLVVSERRWKRERGPPWVWLLLLLLHVSPVSFMRMETWEMGLKAWHAKRIACHGVLWQIIISRIIHAILPAVFPKAVKEPGEYETVITLSPSLCFGA